MCLPPVLPASSKIVLRYENGNTIVRARIICAVLDEGNVFTIFTTDIAMLVRGLYDPAEVSLLLRGISQMYSVWRIRRSFSICLQFVLRGCVLRAGIERERLGVDCSFYCNKTKCWQGPEPGVISLSRGCWRPGIGHNAINIIILHLISVCQKTRRILITSNVFITGED